MDETRHNTIITGIIAITLMVSACTGTTPESAAQEIAAIDHVQGDQYGPPAQAIAQLAAYLQTIGTTVPKTPQNNGINPPTPANPIDHAEMWDILAQCETGGNWSANTGNGYGGGLQFAHTAQWSTWRAYGGEAYTPHPWQASREQQINVGERVLASAGFKAWPGCARANGWL